MAKVVLHIGTHKTATTTIQDMFWANADLLAQHGVIYPRLGKIAGHHGLVYAWSAMPSIYQLPLGGRETLAQIAQDYAKGDHTVFLSSEEFSRGNPKSAVNFAEVRELLKDFDQIEVLCVLRTQWEFLQSVYLELSKKRLPPRPPALVDQVLKSGMIDGLWADYNGLLSQLEAVFDPSEITFLDFNTCRTAPGGILTALLTHIGCPLTANDLEKVYGGSSNVSPLSLASWASNVLSEPKIAPPWLVARATQLLKQEKGEDVVPCLFSRGEFDTLRAYFDVKNETLHQRRQPWQPEFRISPPDGSRITLFRNEVPLNFWVQIARGLVAEKL